MPRIGGEQTATANHFPALMVNESMMGYLVRVGLLNQLSLSGTSSLVLGLNSCLEPPWVVPSNLDRLSRSASGTLGTANDLLLNNTVFPVVAPFLAPQVRSRLALQMTSDLLPGRHQSKIRSNTWEGNVPAQFRWCTKCVLDDETEQGFYYWHREHQLAVCTHCPRHGCALVTGCGYCTFPRNLRTSPSLPTARCRCGRELRALSALSFVQGDGSAMARSHELVRSMFEDPLQLDEQDHIGATMQQRAIQLELMTKAGVRRATVMKLVEDAGGMQLVQSTLGGPEAALNWLSSVLRSGRTVANLAVNVFIITTLFPSTQSFRVALEQSRSVRRVGVDFRKPATNHVRDRTAGTTRYVERRLEKDKLISDAIRLRHTSVLASNEQPVRFTRSFFLADIEGGRSIVRKLELYPLSASTIGELSETREQYQL
jgi:hypothetical protein